MNEHTDTICSLFKQKILNKFISVLAENGYSERDYSLNGYAEMKICMEKTGTDEWEVFVGERGMKHYLTKHLTVEAACNQMMDLLVSDEDLYKEMEESFLQIVKDI